MYGVREELIQDGNEVILKTTETKEFHLCRFPAKSGECEDSMGVESNTLTWCNTYGSNRSGCPFAEE